MPNIILTSSFKSVAKELQEKDVLPKKAVRVAFVPTASDVYVDKPWVENDRKALADLGYMVFDVGLKEQTVEALRQALASADAVFVAGGNTTYLTECAHRSGFGLVVRELLVQGGTYIGSSAGSILAGPSVEPFVAEDLPELPHDFVLHDQACLGLVGYIVLPHQATLQEYDQKMKTFGHRFSFVQLTDQDYRMEDYSNLSVGK